MERLHKLSAGVVVVFLCLHFTNHFVGLKGVDAHQQFLEAVRIIYRDPIVEVVVLLAFAAQIITGIPLVREIWSQKKDFVHQLQAASGTIIAVYVLIHVLSVFVMRSLSGLDTNFYFVTATLQSPAWKYPAFAFYGLGVMAVFVHMGGIVFDIFKKASRPAGYAGLALCVLVGGFSTWQLMSLYAGKIVPVNLPEDYRYVFGVDDPQADSGVGPAPEAAPEDATGPDTSDAE